MDKQRILIEAKSDMEYIIQEMELTTRSIAKTNLERYFEFLEVLETMPDIQIPVKEIAPKAVEDKEVQEVIEEINEEINEEIRQREIDDLVYKFDRRIKGGFLQEINAFVPEKVVRELDLQHGDLVHAVKIQDATPDSPPHYDFSVAEYKDEPAPKDRVQINYGVVGYDKLLGRYTVDTTMDGKPIRIGEALQTILINEKDVEDFKLEEGDIVDLAYYTTQSEFIRIIWRYTIDTATDRPRTTSSKRKVEKETKMFPQTLEGKTILMIGFEPGRTSFEEEVNRRGGELIWASGREGETRLQSIVSKADAVVMMLSQMGHRGSIDAVEYCKEKGIPCKNMHSLGRSLFIQKVYEALDIKEEEVKKYA